MTALEAGTVSVELEVYAALSVVAKAGENTRLPLPCRLWSQRFVWSHSGSQRLLVLIESPLVTQKWKDDVFYGREKVVPLAFNTLHNIHRRLGHTVTLA